MRAIEIAPDFLLALLDLGPLRKEEDRYGEALDCFWVVDGRAEWSTVKKVNGLNGYHVYAEEAEELELTAGGHWTTLKDWPHVQVRAASSPGKIMSINQIDEGMRARFG